MQHDLTYPAASAPKTLILGGGYVGSAIARVYREYSLPHRLARRAAVDYTDRQSFGDLLAEERPWCVVNAAGYTGRPNVDACEDDKVACYEANVNLPVRLAQACRDRNVVFGHVSSGCIFNGAGPFTEYDPPNFGFETGSFYSGTKALAEQLIRKAHPYGHYIWRPRMPFDGRNDDRNLLNKLAKYEKLVEAENSVTHLRDFAINVACCLLARSRDGSGYGWDRGTYNMVNPVPVRTSTIVGMMRAVEHCIRSALRAPAEDFAWWHSVEEFQQAQRAPRSFCRLATDRLWRVGRYREEHAYPGRLFPWTRPAISALAEAMDLWATSVHYDSIKE